MSVGAKMRRFIHRMVVYVALCLLAALFAGPFVWMVLTSLKADSEVLTSPPIWIPRQLQWDHYPKALLWGCEEAVPATATAAQAWSAFAGLVAKGKLAAIPFLRYTFNTLWITGWCIVGSLVSCSLAAYGFARLKWPGRDALFFLLLSTMMLPGFVTLIPVLVLFKKLGWVGTYLPLTVPAFFGSAFYIFLLRQFFLTIPMELSEAAVVDGCSEFGIYRRIVLPLAKPALAIVALFTFVASWNDFLGPLIYLSRESQYTLSLGLQMFVGQHSAEWQKLMAASAVMILPVLLVFFFAQRTFIEGISLTGLKG